jgi:hypothetical protein
MFKKLDGGMDWIALAQGSVMWWAFVNTGNEPLVSIKCGEILEYLRTG